MRSPHLLVFEPESDGHQAEYLRALLGYWQSQPSAGLRLTLATSRELQDRLPELRALRGERGDALRVVTLSSDDCELCSSGSAWRRSWARWKLLARHVSSSQPDLALAIHLDVLQLPLAAGLRSRVPLYGVLFRPSLHYGRVDPVIRAPLGHTRRRLKAMLLRAALRNPSLECVLAHDESFVEFAAQRLDRGGDRIRHIPNPLPPFRELLARGPEAPAWIAEIPGQRVCFALFGALSRRKGLFSVLEALERLEPRETRRLALVLAGSVDARIRSELLSRISSLRRRAPECWILLEDRFVSDVELAALLRRADVVLAPYVRFVGTSGVVLWAVAAGRPVLAQDYGYLGRFVREHRLGITADCADPRQLAAALARCLAVSGQGLCDAAGMERLAEAHAPERFASVLLAPAAARAASEVGALAGTNPPADRRHP